MQQIMMETEVMIEDKVYFMYRDVVADGPERYNIVEDYVEDISVNHGFTLCSDGSLWHDEAEIGERIFLTIDEAVEYFRDEPDYQGFCFHYANGDKWIFSKVNGEKK